MSAHKYSFTKDERLKSRKEIELVFHKGKNVFTYPFKCYYTSEIHAESKYLPQILVSVPKRTFKSAVDRNILKRRIKESYRLNASGWKEQAKQYNVKLVIIFIGREILPYSDIEKGMKKLLNEMKRLLDVKLGSS